MEIKFYNLFPTVTKKWRRQCHPTPVLLPRKSHGQRRLVCCSPWSHEESDMIKHFTCTFHFYALEKEMATHSSVLAWRIPGMGSHRVGHNWSDLAAAVIKYKSSLVAQSVKSLSTTQNIQVQSLEKEMATHFSILAWRIPWTEKPSGLHSPLAHKESDTTKWLTNTLTFITKYINWDLKA